MFRTVNIVHYNGVVISLPLSRNLGNLWGVPSCNMLTLILISLCYLAAAFVLCWTLSALSLNAVQIACMHFPCYDRVLLFLTQKQ